MGNVVSKVVGAIFGSGNAKLDTSAYDRAAASQAAAEEAAANLQKNLATDLGTDTNAQVVSSGTADAGSQLGTTIKRRRPATGSLSSTLGINA